MDAENMQLETRLTCLPVTGQPPAKLRKTHIETAGEVRQPYAPQQSIRRVNSTAKSAIARPNLSASTNRTASSYPPNSSNNGTYRQGLQRSQSAMGQTAINRVQTLPRPGTAHGSRQLPSITQANEPTAAKPSGTESISFISSNINSLARHKTRKRVVSEQSIASSRASSSCSGTTLASSIPGISRSNSVAIVGHKDSRVSSLSALSSAFNKVTLQDQPELEEDQSLSYCETNGAAQPKTPRPPQSSQIPISTPKKNLDTSVVRFQAPLTLFKPRANSSPHKSPSRPLFMSKDTNLLAPIAWDAQGAIDKRLENMQNMFESMKSQMDGTNFESKGMKDIIELLRARGMWHFLCAHTADLCSPSLLALPATPIALPSGVFNLGSISIRSWTCSTGFSYVHFTDKIQWPNWMPRKTG